MTTRTPANLAAAGRRLWRSVADDYELRADELVILEKACRTADESARLDAAVAAAPLIVPGSKGQDVPNPLLQQARATRQLLATLLKQLGLPDEDADAEGPSANSLRAMKAARARWGAARGGIGVRRAHA